MGEERESRGECGDGGLWRLVNFGNVMSVVVGEVGGTRVWLMVEMRLVVAGNGVE